MSDLEKRQRAREFAVEAGGRVYTLRRPTARERLEQSAGTRLDQVRACVVGWNLTRLDLYPGGDASPAAFDAATWSDWLDDNPALWDPLMTALEARLAAHDAALEAAEKN